MRCLADSSGREEEKRREGEEGCWNGERIQPKGAVACSALILKSTLVGLASPSRRQPSAFSFLSFYTFQYETGAAARRKSSKLPLAMSWEWKTLFLRPPFLRSSSVPIPLWQAWRLSVPSFRHRQQSRRENDSIGFWHVFVQSILNGGWRQRLRSHCGSYRRQKWIKT